ncbi:DUF4286 family protein [Nocardioides pocheonensis]|uniref:Uncharacterized protein n=1 Tax=Nocardioides pocheonensis TaxID=661485 RepID=A0A3N0GJG2_9ACTN|nr:DUF4286 family protein [Nocardioides pocheonensis]RNM12190.1 hypothetical protein EFL26_20520 [Nocardioides pocheonensis]
MTFIRVPAWHDARTPQYEYWYDNVHIPLRMRQPGFLGAQRYETLLGRQRYFVLYELADATATESPEYLALRSWEAAQPADSFEAPATSRPGFERGIYDQTAGPSWPDPSLTAPVAHIAGFQPSEISEEEFLKKLELMYGTLFRAIPQIAAVRLFRLTGHSFRGSAKKTQMHTRFPRVIAISYLAEESVMNAAKFAEVQRDARLLENQRDHEPYLMVGRLKHTAFGAAG